MRCGDRPCPIRSAQVDPLRLTSGRPAVDNVFDSARSMRLDVIEVGVQAVEPLIKPSRCGGRTEEDHWKSGCRLVNATEHTEMVRQVGNSDAILLTAGQVLDCRFASFNLLWTDDDGSWDAPALSVLELIAEPLPPDD